MSKQVILKSFADLALVFDLNPLPSEAAIDATGALTAAEASPGILPLPDLDAILRELEAAQQMLAATAERDAATKQHALDDLDLHDAAVEAQRQAEAAVKQARHVREEAERLAEIAFTMEGRRVADEVATRARQAETSAALLADQHRVAAEELAMQLDLERLLAERRRAAEAEATRQAEIGRQQRVADAITIAENALRGGDGARARAALDSVADEAGVDPSIAALRQRVRRHEMAERITRAENALWAARRDMRRDAAGALSHLEAVSVDGLPDELRRQVFGAWTQVCLRVCRDRALMAPLRYAPTPGHGVVIAREAAEAEYTVVSALDTDEWRPGQRVSRRLVELARPLR